MHKRSRFGVPGALLPLAPWTRDIAGVYGRLSAPFLDDLAAVIGPRKVLEVFAGNGFFAAQLAARGVAITATTQFSGHDAHEYGLYYDVEELEAVAAVQAYGATHDVLLMCWPTTTPRALQAVEAWGGEKEVVFVGEVTDYAKGHLGGCATDAFFERMHFHRRLDCYRGNVLEAALIGRLKSL